ncbi:MAG: radical SAM protein [Lentisphaeria bacterium]|nr:radical SAM protein [Lentisphaeria bacterium]
MLPLIESFVSIQGESTHAGRRCFFIRLAGCNLRCKYCDTPYAWDGGEMHSVDELTRLAQQSKAPLVEVTGGEPLIHGETIQLLNSLLNAGLEVLLETNGAVSIAQVPEQVRKIIDCKLPDSGMSDRNIFENYALLLPHDEVKFVVSSRRDFDWAVGVIDQYELETKTPNLIFSPVWGKVEFENLAQWVIDSGRNIRMQLQLHKLIWGDRKGV